ncbi:MAG: MbnP family protein [Ferruginibacter sp.]
MNRSFLHKKFYWFIASMIVCIAALSFKNAENKTGTLKITFVNTANGKVITLRDSLYTNAFGEAYSISKLKYYISNFSVPGSSVVDEIDPYHLINVSEENNNSFEVSLSPGNYKNISFLLGVDSIRNCSGAQTGALDPTNDMFWTWNSGYVMFKLEGTSTASKSDLQRIEHHIGGYKGANSVVTKINLNFSEEQLLQIKENGTTELVIETNLDHYWNSKSEIKISETPICTLTGDLAKKIASNFTGMFSVKSLK